MRQMDRRGRKGPRMGAWTGRGRVGAWVRGRGKAVNVLRMSESV